MTMSFHTIACRWPDAPCACKAEMFIVFVSVTSSHETPCIVAASTCRDEAANIAYAWHDRGWAVTCATEVVDLSGAAELEARKAADERRLYLAA